MDRTLVVYMRATPCSDVGRTQRDLREWNIPYQQIDIEADPAAARRLEGWTGFLSVPTLLIAEPGSAEPYQPPAGLVPGQTPRNVDRGCLITEPSTANLRAFLEHNGVLHSRVAPFGPTQKG